MRTLSLALLLVASAGLVVGSSGFTNASADRSVSVQVVDDDHAFVGYQAHDRTVDSGDTVTLVTVENRFDHDVHVTDVVIEDGDRLVTITKTPGEIGSGDSGNIRGTVACNSDQRTDIALTVTVTGEAVTAQLFGDTETREFTITCDAPTTTSTQSGG
jgi:plastocyanin